MGSSMGIIQTVAVNTVMKSGELISASEIRLLASVGVMMVKCVSKANSCRAYNSVTKPWPDQYLHNEEDLETILDTITRSLVKSKSPMPPFRPTMDLMNAKDVIQTLFL